MELSHLQKFAENIESMEKTAGFAEAANAIRAFRGAAPKPAIKDTVLLLRERMAARAASEAADTASKAKSTASPVAEKVIPDSTKPSAEKTKTKPDLPPMSQEMKDMFNKKKNNKKFPAFSANAKDIKADKKAKSKKSNKGAAADETPFYDKAKSWVKANPGMAIGGGVGVGLIGAGMLGSKND